MLRILFAATSGSLAFVLIACGGFSGAATDLSESDPVSTDIPKERTLDAEVSIQEKLVALEKNIDEAVEQFGADVTTNATRMFQHTIWASADEATIKNKLYNNGYTLVGDVIRGADQSGSGIDVWRVESPPLSGGQAYVATNGDNLVVSFRSTHSEDGWEKTLNVLTDIRAYHTKIDFIDDTVPNVTEYREIDVHAGFHNEYLRYRNTILEYVGQHPDKNIYVTGHSLGGALSVLNAFDIAAHTERRVTIFTFGQPRVGGEKFRKAYEELVPDSYRVVVDGDPIARVPGIALDYEHAGKLLQVNQEGTHLPPDSIDTSALFKSFDLPKHFKGSYYGALTKLQTICDSDESKEGDPCLNVGWLVATAVSEREASRKAWDIVPPDSIPWENVHLNQVSIEDIPLDRLSLEFPDPKMPPWRKMASVRKIFVDNIPIDEIPLGSLVGKTALEDIPLDDLLSDFSVDRLPVDKLPVDKLPLDKFWK